MVGKPSNEENIKLLALQEMLDTLNEQFIDLMLHSKLPPWRLMTSSPR